MEEQKKPIEKVVVQKEAIVHKPKVYVYTDKKELMDKVNAVKRVYGSGFNEAMLIEGLKAIVKTEEFQKRRRIILGNI